MTNFDSAVAAFIAKRPRVAYSCSYVLLFLHMGWMNGMSVTEWSVDQEKVQKEVQISKDENVSPPPPPPSSLLMTVRAGLFFLFSIQRRSRIHLRRVSSGAGASTETLNLWGVSPSACVKWSATGCPCCARRCTGVPSFYLAGCRRSLCTRPCRQCMWLRKYI